MLLVFRHIVCTDNVEMEIVLPGSMTVIDSHDIALALQHKIEAMIDVERAFVHVDHQERDGLEHKVNFVSDYIFILSTWFLICCYFEILLTCLIFWSLLTYISLHFTCHIIVTPLHSISQLFRNLAEESLYFILLNSPSLLSHFSILYSDVHFLIKLLIYFCYINLQFYFFFLYS